MLRLTKKEVKTILASTANYGISLMYCTEEEADKLAEKLEAYANKEETWLTRLEDEARELHEKIEKLYAFKQTEAFTNLGAFDQEMLATQYCNMYAYHTTLAIRINKEKLNV